MTDRYQVCELCRQVNPTRWNRSLVFDGVTPSVRCADPAECLQRFGSRFAGDVEAHQLHALDSKLETVHTAAIENRDDVDIGVALSIERNVTAARARILGRIGIIAGRAGST